MTDKADDLEARAAFFRRRAARRREAGDTVAADVDIRMAEELEFQAERRRQGRLK